MIEFDMQPDKVAKLNHKLKQAYVHTNKTKSTTQVPSTTVK